MDLQTAEALALSLMREHGLKRMKFKFDNSVQRAAVCLRNRLSDMEPVERRQGTISVSKIYTEQWDEKHFVETVLHEIAHALTPLDYASHGPEWRATALAIGSNGERCVTEEQMIEVPADHYKWIKFCPNGHYTLRLRKTQRVTSCGKCCKTFNYEFEHRWMKNSEINREAMALLQKKKLVSV